MARSTRNKIKMHWASAINHVQSALSQMKAANDEAGDGQPIFNEYMPVLVDLQDKFEKALTAVYERL